MSVIERQRDCQKDRKPDSQTATQIKEVMSRLEQGFGERQEKSVLKFKKREKEERNKGEDKQKKGNKEDRAEGKADRNMIIKGRQTATDK